VVARFRSLIGKGTTMRKGVRLRYGGLLLALALLLAAPPGCTNFERQGCTGFGSYVGAYFKNRAQDMLRSVDIGYTFSSKPQFSFYAALLSGVPFGYGDVNGTYVGIGGGDIGVFPVAYQHYGIGIYGREKTVWGDSLWDYGDFDVDDETRTDSQGVGFLGVFAPPYDAQPTGRPT